MDDFNYTDIVETDICDPYNSGSTELILEYYFNISEGEDMFLYASADILYRWIFQKLSLKYNLKEDSREENVKILSERIPYDESMEFCDMYTRCIKENKRELSASEAWSRWLTVGFNNKQREYIYRIAICGKMEEETLKKLLVSVDGEYINKRNPNDQLYYYSYCRGYSLSRADQINRLYHEKLNNFNKLERFCDTDEEFIYNNINGFDRYNVSSQLTVRYLVEKYEDAYGLKRSTKSRIIEKLKEIIVNDHESELHLISENCRDWEEWMTRGFEANQRHLAIKFAICVRMKEEDLLAMLDYIPKGSRKDEEDPYYYSYENGFSLKEADYIFERVHGIDVNICNSIYENHYIQFCKSKDQNEWDWRKKIHKTGSIDNKEPSRIFLRSYFFKKYEDRIPENLTKEEVNKLIVSYIMTDYPNIESGEKTIYNWIDKGIDKGNYLKVCQFGIAIVDMNYNDYIDLLYSVNGVRYDFSAEYYCLYDYCKYMGYGSERTKDLVHRWLLERNDPGLTHHFDSYIDSDKNEDLADIEFIDELVRQTRKMNKFSIGNIARYVRLLQYVAVKFDGENGIDIKTKYNGLFPNASDIYKAVIGAKRQNYKFQEVSKSQETHGSGTGIIWDNIGKYFLDGGRINNKYAILMGDPKGDLRAAEVRRVEILMYLVPFLLIPERKVTKTDLRTFPQRESKQNENIDKIQDIWNHFDIMMEQVQLKMDEINCTEKNDKSLMNQKERESLYKKYVEIFNLVFNEFEMYPFYPLYLGDRFFMKILLCSNPMYEIEKNILNYSNYNDDPEEFIDNRNSQTKYNYTY